MKKSSSIFNSKARRADQTAIDLELDTETIKVQLEGENKPQEREKLKQYILEKLKDYKSGKTAEDELRAKHNQRVLEEEKKKEVDPKRQQEREKEIEKQKQIGREKMEKEVKAQEIQKQEREKKLLIERATIEKKLEGFYYRDMDEKKTQPPYTPPPSFTPPNPSNPYLHKRIYPLSSKMEELIQNGSTAVQVITSSGHYFGNDYNDRIEPCNWHGRKILCQFTTKQAGYSNAQALWYHAPTFSGAPANDPRKKKIVMSMESDVNYGNLKSPQFMNQFDIIMTYRRDSDVPVVYPSFSEYGTFMEPPLPLSSKSKNGLAPAVYIQSNCLPFRDDYVKQLMNYMKVDSLGKCINNKKMEDILGKDWQGGWGTAKIETVRRYKFNLLFENSITDDFVTERLFHALTAGTVPVYMGAPNVQLYAPSDKSVINIGDFKSPKDLADYLKYLDSNDTAYEEYLSWKKTGYSESFKRLVDINSVHSRCRVS